MMACPSKGQMMEWLVARDGFLSCQLRLNRPLRSRISGLAAERPAFLRVQNRRYIGSGRSLDFVHGVGLQCWGRAPEKLSFLYENGAFWWILEC